MAKMIQFVVSMPVEMADYINETVDNIIGAEPSKTASQDYKRNCIADAFGYDLTSFYAERDGDKLAKLEAKELERRVLEMTRTMSVDEMRTMLAMRAANVG